LTGCQPQRQAPEDNESGRLITGVVRRRLEDFVVHDTLGIELPRGGYATSVLEWLARVEVCDRKEYS
jgi:hypothetical protein